MSASIKRAFDKFCNNPWSVAKKLARHGWLNFIPDKAYLSIMFRANLGKRMNWRSPRTYNEKLQWLKLYDRKAIYPKMVDKFEAKQYIADRVGSQFVPKVVGGPWDSFNKIDFTMLPEQFVLKTTHDCGGVWICKDKCKINMVDVRSFIEGHMKDNYYRKHREWPYKHIHPRIFAEEYLEDRTDGELKDYKFFTFNGIPKMMFIASERNNESVETKFDFYDMDFQRLSIVNGHSNSEKYMAKPVHFEKMKRLASRLSEDIPHLRVDFYETNGRLYVGELTFFHYSGFVPFSPPEWDEILGTWLPIPQKKERI